MKLSELIQELQNKQKELGDIDPEVLLVIGTAMEDYTCGIESVYNDEDKEILIFNETWKSLYKWYKIVYNIFIMHIKALRSINYDRSDKITRLRFIF